MNREILRVVEAVRAVKKATMFDAETIWRYEAISDEKACELCLYYEHIHFFSGEMLRNTFPYLEVLDENEIAVNVHPNCRCRLHRAYS